MRVHVLIRPRPGDFVYSEREKQASEKYFHDQLPPFSGGIKGIPIQSGNVCRQRGEFPCSGRPEALVV